MNMMKRALLVAAILAVTAAGARADIIWTVGGEGAEEPFGLVGDSQSYNVETADSGMVSFWVVNVNNDTWRDFHFEIANDEGDFSILGAGSGNEPTMSQSGTFATSHPESGFTTVDYYFAGDPVLTDGTAHFEFYVDNLNALEDYTITAWPTPEPTTLALLAGGGLLAALRRKGRKA